MEAGSRARWGLAGLVILIGVGAGVALWRTSGTGPVTSPTKPEPAAPEPVRGPDVPAAERTWTGPVDGFVRTPEGTAVRGARVLGGGGRTVTDRDGRFALDPLPPGVRGIRVDADGFATGVGVLHTDTATVSVVLAPLTHVGRIDGGTGGRTIGPDGIRLTLPPQGVDGPIVVRWASLRDTPTLPTTPGRLQASDGSLLQSYGMLDVQLTRADGAPHPLVGTAEIRWPLADLPGPSDDRDGLALWSLDIDRGVWVQEGTLRIEGDQAIGEVTHFSWVAVARPLASLGCACVRVGPSGGGGVLASVSGTTLLTVTNGWIPDGQERCLDGPGGQTVSVRAQRLMASGCSPSATATADLPTGTSWRRDRTSCVPVALDVPARCPEVVPVPSAPVVVPPAPAPAGVRPVPEPVVIPVPTPVPAPAVLRPMPAPEPVLPAPRPTPTPAPR